VPPSAGGAPVVVSDVDGDGLPVSPVGGGELVVGGAEGDVLVAGGDCGGAEDFRALVVGLAERVAVGAFDSVPRLVPVESPPTGLAGSEAVVGVAATLADWPGDLLCPTFPVNPAGGFVLLVSRSTMIAMIPQAARPAPANTRARRRGRGSGDHGGSLL
jgi:hypothetical protein